MPAHREEKKGSQLQRGSACLSCRRRKIRCNGDRPYCGPCSEHQRPQECVYEDHRKKSRTQLLREKVASLEKKLAELEANPALTPTYFHDSPIESSSYTSSPPIVEGASDFSVWQPPEAPVLELSSSLPWPDLSGSSHWVMDNPFQGLGSNLLPLRQATPDSNVNLSPETQQYLLDIFIAHRAQCHFYSNMTRFQLPLLQQIEEQPHPALLQAINLMGCYFSRDPQLRSLETDLLKHSLYEITASLRDCRHLPDVVQASSLLALYCYFNGRFVEGYRHAFVAARLAVALGLHQIPYPDQKYSQNYAAYYDLVAAFWQVYMVDRAWSGAHGILSALSEDECRGQIITPMMWTSDPMEMMNPILTPSYLCELLNPHLINPSLDAISLPGLKALASAIFDRTFRPVTDDRDQIPKPHPSVIVAMQRIQTVLPPFMGREIWLPQAPHVDVELLVVHTMLRVVELNVCEETENKVGGDTKMLWAVDWLARSVDQLQEADYAFLDPLIAGVWNQGAKLLIQKSRQMKGLFGTPNTGRRSIPSAMAFVDHCVGMIFRALRSLSSYTQVAVDHIESLEQDYIPIGRTIALDIHPQ